MQKIRGLLLFLVFVLLITGCSSALVKASENGDIETANTLLNQGADIEELSYELTPLMSAARYGKLDMVKLLLVRGANVNVKNSDGTTALKLASGGGYTEIVKLLLDRGANVNACDEGNRTALHLATLENHADIVKILIEKNADLSIKGYCTAFGKSTALQVAEDNGNIQIIQMLKAAESKSTGKAQKSGEIKEAVSNSQSYVKSEQIGSISSLNTGKREIVVSTKRILKIGELVYVVLNGNKVIMSSTFPMMTSTKCQLEGDDTKYFEKLTKGMPVYKY